MSTNPRSSYLSTKQKNTFSATHVHKTLRQRIQETSLLSISLSVIAFLWIPIIVLIIFSFNDSRTVNQWRGFTTIWYQNIFTGVTSGEARFATDLMLSSLKNSLFIGVIATIIATIIGTLVAYSFARGQFPGKRFLQGLLFFPLVIPEIAQGVSLAMFFVIAFNAINTLTGNRPNFGFETIIIGHVAFNISYVAIVVGARFSHLNENLEEASADLGANEWQTFWRITFPQLVPGILAGALLAFTLSLDDYVVTFFNSGIGTSTLPMFVYGMLKTSVTPEINAISTLMLVASTILIVISLVLQRDTS